MLNLRNATRMDGGDTRREMVLSMSGLTTKCQVDRIETKWR